MGKILIYRLFICTYFIQGAFSGECKPGDHMTMERKLYAKLMCNYKKDVRPVLKYETSVNVTTEISILSLQASYAKTDVDTITLQTVTVLRWKDEFLTWDPKQYGGIKELAMESTGIWTPEISVINVNKHDRQFITKPCIVYSSGKVFCTEKFTYSTVCSKTYKDWPYDKHNCTMVFGIWMTKEHADIRFIDSEIGIEYPQPNKYWKILEATIESADETIKNLRHPRVAVKLEIERNSVVVENNYLIPVVAMIIISLSSLCLDINSAERMVMMLYNIYLHFRYLEVIGYFAPTVENDVPHAVIYIRDSLFLSCGILIIGMLLVNVSKQSSVSPRWVKSINEMMQSTVGRIIMFDDEEPTSSPSAEMDDDEDEDASKTELKSLADKEWDKFARILNRVFLICVIMIYVFLILRFLI